MQPKTPIVRYRNVSNFKGLKADNFVFETSLKNTFKQGSAVCQKAGITILCKNDEFYIPLSVKGCIGGLELFLGDHLALSEHKD